MTSEQAREVIARYSEAVHASLAALDAWLDAIKARRAEPLRADLVAAASAACAAYEQAKATMLDMENSGDLYKARDRVRRDNIPTGGGTRG